MNRKYPFGTIALALSLCAFANSLTARAQDDAPAVPPPKYVDSHAYYILPERHNNQSGYFSLCEGLDGSIYVGTCRYGENSHLVKFDPRTESQRIVVDTHQLCGVDAKGYAAQAKIHTRNFVSDSGKIWFGSKQGYRMDDSDTSEYPGGYVMVYDPRTGEGKCLGMPYPGEGVIDVVADEKKELLFVVTCEEQHWMIGDLSGGPYRELGPILTPYATTLLAADGNAYAITADFQLARYNPETRQTDVRPITVGDTAWQRENEMAIPTWVLTGDGKRAWLILLNDTRLLEIDLLANGEAAPARDHGKMLEGNNPDSRCGLDLGADGNVYAVIRIDNDTGFGDGYLHHLVRFVTESQRMEDLGVLRVDNPDYFDWEQRDAEGNPPKWTHGFHRLPDGSLTPLHAHMALKVAHDNTVYVTVIYPFTLLKTDQVRIEEEAGANARAVLDEALQACDSISGAIPEYTATAETVAQRHLAGGAIGFPLIQQAVAQDLWGRSGGMIHIGFERIWKSEQTEFEKRNNVAIVAWEAVPDADDAARLRELKDQQVYMLGIGAMQPGTQSAVVDLCDKWFNPSMDSGEGHSGNGSLNSRAGKAAANAIAGHTLIAEVVGALTRHGKMPTMWKGYAWDDGREWGDRYFGKTQFHEDFSVPAVPAGDLGSRFVHQLRYPVNRLRAQSAALAKAADTLRSAIDAGETVYVVWQGHMPPTYIGKDFDSKWAVPVELHPFLPDQVARFRESVPDGALVLSLGYHGLDPVAAEVWKEKNLRVIHLCGDHPDPKWRRYDQLARQIDLGFAFGDACVTLDGYPIKLFAPSGVAQAVAWAAILGEIEGDSRGVNGAK